MVASSSSATFSRGFSFVGVTGKGGEKYRPFVTAGDQASSYPVLSVIVTAVKETGLD
jgi:hypothetical protein